MNKLKEDFENFAKSYQVSDTILQKRIDICNGCDKKGVKLSYEVCTECNCILYLKQRMKTADCPLSKW